MNPTDPGDAGADLSRREGLFASARGLAVTGLAIAANRLSLLSIEVSEESSRLLSIMMYGAVALLALGAGVIFLAIFVTVALWDSNRLLALGMCATLFLGAGIVSLVVTRNLLRTRSQLFAASLAELQRDQASLDPR